MRTSFRVRQPYADIFLRCADEYICQSPARPLRFMRKMRENTGIAGASFGLTDEQGLERKNPVIVALGYAPPEKQADMICTPLNTSPEILEQLPPAIVQTCGLDPMRVEGEAYAKLLGDAGVPLRSRCFPGVLHGFTEGLDEPGRQGRQWIIDAVRELKWTE